MIHLLVQAIWIPWLLGLFLVIGAYFTICSGFFPFAGLRIWLKATIGSSSSGHESTNKTGLTPVQAVATALGSTVGTGSVAGVSTAIFFGGPGAVFWLWVSALLGMTTGFVEKTLSVRYRVRGQDGGWHGGPMYYMERGLGWRRAAVFFSLICILSSLMGGNVVQVNAITDVMQSAYGFRREVTGLLVMLLVAAVILGGVHRIGGLCELLVPLMTLLFLLGGCVVILCNRDSILPVLHEIWHQAFQVKSAAGGGAGYGVLAAMRYGIARGVFTNEAGVGSSAIAHAASETNDPVRQGFWGIFEVFAATMLICTVSALAILTSGVYVQENALTWIQAGTVDGQQIGAALSLAAFSSVLGRSGQVLLTVCLLLFAFTSILGWSYYGEQSLSYLTGSKCGIGLYRIIFLVAIFCGSAADTQLVWQITDLCTALMALPNLCALLLLSPEAFTLLKAWRTKR